MSRRATIGAGIGITVFAAAGAVAMYLLYRKKQSDAIKPAATPASVAPAYAGTAMTAATTVAPAPVPAPQAAVPENSPLRKATMIGFGYANCDGNYVFDHYDENGNLLVFMVDKENPMPGQDTNRRMHVSRTALGVDQVTCLTADGIGGFGLPRTEGATFTYQPSLWDVATK